MIDEKTVTSTFYAAKCGWCLRIFNGYEHYRSLQKLQQSLRDSGWLCRKILDGNGKPIEHAYCSPECRQRHENSMAEASDEG